MWHCPVAMMLCMLMLNTDSTEGKKKEGMREENLKCYLSQGV